MQNPTRNADPAELAKFAALAQSWWDPKGPSKPLHDLNPLRLQYIERAVSLPGKQALDVGCGGGILSEAMARAGARVLGIDLSQSGARRGGTARARGQGRRGISGRRGGGSGAGTPRGLRSGDLHGDARARARSGRQHRGAGRTGEARRHVIVSTLNRNPLAFAVAIVGAEYIARVLPRGTHEYLKFIRPSELARWGREAGLELRDLTGISYNPLTRAFRLSPNTDVNYLAHFTRRMSGAAPWLAMLVGAALGALAVLVWRARRERTLAVETELLRARLKSEETLSAEREQALARAREQLQAVFGDLARDSLQSNSEVFLQLARERLTRQQSDASQALKERETAIESLVQPIREALAKTEAQIQAIERDRIDSFASIKTQMEALAGGQNLLSRETRNLVTALRRPDVRGQWGEITLRRLVELSGMTLHVDFTEQQHRSHRVRRDPSRHGGAHAGSARYRRRRENAARCLSLGGRGSK